MDCFPASIVITSVTVGAIIVLVGEMKVAGQSDLGLKENEKGMRQLNECKAVSELKRLTAVS